ncbi:hypothetical protein AX16_009241 [Volvariella volvacea WC 439]|nr:hypothetical protein AX16_009241 [Volvariella volvacea WC 439]
MGLPWLNSPVMLHSVREGYGTSTHGGHGGGEPMTEEQMALRATRFRNWYTADWDYALTTVYFFCGAIGLFTIFNLLSLRKPGRSGSGISFYQKMLGLSRYLATRQFYISALTWYSPPVGILLLGAALVVFFFSLTFSVRPYYWPNPSMGGSPPLATRSGWMTAGMLPFVMSLATKLNFIGVLTGVPHEKLQVFHRWTGWIIYLLALLHTFPFIVTYINQGTIATLWETRPYYWTGVAALIPQTWLTFMSWGPIRNRFYETFKKLHFIAAGLFVGFFFVHCNFRLSSWDYMISSVVVYAAAWFIRQGRTYFVNGGHVASFELLPDQLVKVSIPTKLKWKPGQHYFVRFLDLGIHALTSHPFTVTSIPSGDGKNTIEFYIRVREGITARLASFAEQGKTSSVILDGPYGGVHGSLKDYERVLLFTGGSGASFSISLLKDLVQNTGNVLKSIDFIWAVSNEDDVTWHASTLNSIIASSKVPVSVNIHITGSYRSASPASKEDKHEFDLHNGRPNIAQFVHNAANNGDTLGIAACGPNSFTLDVRNAVAEHELKIFSGSSKSPEIFLHTEAFSW